MKHTRLVLSGMLLFLTHCGTFEGGTETGNPSSLTTITGNVRSSTSTLSVFSVSSLAFPSQNNSLVDPLQSMTGSDPLPPELPRQLPPPPSNPLSGGQDSKNDVSSCAANTLTAISSKNEKTETLIDSDCSFSIEIATGKSYSFIFEQSGRHVGRMFFGHRNDQLESSSFFIPSGVKTLSMGRIRFSDQSAIPANDPSKEIDRDLDGQNDHEDSDDDNDGIEDQDEEDCDLDGFLDDFDQDSFCAIPPDVPVLHVHPSSFSVIRSGVAEVIRFVVPCRIDRETLDVHSFQIHSNTETVDCTYSVTQEGRVIQCTPTRNLQYDTTYTARVDNLKCGDGRPIQNISWSWTTEESIP